MSLNPDFEIEEFWYGFKQSMINYYQYIYKKEKITEIKEWSKNLNILQSEKRYEDIEINIQKYIINYAFDLIKNNAEYYPNILLSNIKRWNKISNKYNFNNIENESYNIIYKLFNIYNKIMRRDSIHEYIDIVKDFEIDYKKEVFINLLIFGIKNNEASVVEFSRKFFDIKEIVKNKFDIEINNNLSTIKLLKLVNK